jgi:CheY-like chemotaxis protein
LVDGDRAIQRMIAAVFSADGHLVEPARDGPHALTLLEGGAYDVVIADPREPVSATEVFGDALARRRPDLRARTIFMPADVRPETESWLKGLGFRYLHKPVNARQLRAAVAELLQEAGAQQTG